MSITEIPPRNPVPAAQPPTAPGSDLYDASSWETAYLEMHDVPALLIQLQDDLSRSRQREAFWISVVVHLAIVILVVNSARLEGLMHKRSVILVSPQDLMKQKELTYLELPPDEQKAHQAAGHQQDFGQRPDGDVEGAATGSQGIEEDSGQRATRRARPSALRRRSRSPLRLPRPRRARRRRRNSPRRRLRRTRTRWPACRLRPQESPRRVSVPAPCPRDRPSSRRPARPRRNRGGYGGDGGDYGLGQGKQAGEAIGPLDVLSDTMGVDFGPYLARVLHDVRENWYRIIPESARAPLMKKGKVSIEFAILKDGQVAGLQIVGTSGDVALDRAAYGGITASKPFPPLPTEFGGQYLALRFHFYYNPERSEIQ